MGWDSYGRKVIGDLVPERLYLDEDEALSFCANSVVVGQTVVMAACPPRVDNQLEASGFDVVVVVEVSEFLKAGGGPRCLTLALDVTLGDQPRPAVRGCSHRGAELWSLAELLWPRTGRSWI